jgi:hypothetical protein
MSGRSRSLAMTVFLKLRARSDDPHCRHVEAFEAVAILVLL